MNLIDKAIEQLVPSKPRFKVTLKESYSGGHKADLSRATEPHKGSCNTPIEKLVAHNYQESWEKNKYVINKEIIVNTCQGDISRKIIRFLENNMSQKYPMETKMGVFYRDYAFTKYVPEFDKALISTYNYFVENNDVPNTMKLLEFLFIKHRGDFPEEPKRTKRRRRRR